VFKGFHLERAAITIDPGGKCRHLLYHKPSDRGTVIANYGRANNWRGEEGGEGRTRTNLKRIIEG